MGKEKIKNSGIDSGWRKTSNPRIKRRHDGHLYARFSKYGVRIEQRLHETTIVAAEKALERIDEALRSGSSKEDIRRIFNKSIKDTPVDAVLIGELWEKFIEYRKEGHPQKQLKKWRPKTLRAYVDFWARSFEYFWADKLPEDINEKNWTNFIEAERKRSKKGEGLGFHHHVKYFNTFCSWLVENETLNKKPQLWDPNWSKKEDTEDEDGGLVFTDDQVAKMIAASSGAFGLFIRCAALMGMRSSEITQMKKDRIDLAKQVIRLRASDVKTGSKTDKGRVVPIHPDVLPALKEQIKASAGSAYLFPNKVKHDKPMDPTGFKGRWARLLNGLEIHEGTPHQLRHTFATKAFANKNLNPVLVCKALGMSMQVAMAVYIHFSEDQLHVVSGGISYDKQNDPGTGLGL